MSDMIYNDVMDVYRMLPSEPTSEWINQRQVAAIMGCSPNKVGRITRAGLLVAHIYAGDLRVRWYRRSDVEALMERKAIGGTAN